MLNFEYIKSNWLTFSLFQPLQEASTVATPWLDPVDVFIPYGGKRWLVKESISSKVRKEVRQLRQRAPRKPLVTWLGRSQWYIVECGQQNSRQNWSEDGQTQKCQVIPWSRQEFRSWIWDDSSFKSILEDLEYFMQLDFWKIDWKAKSYFDRPLFRCFLYINIYRRICIHYSGDSLYANMNLPESQIPSFSRFNLTPQFQVILSRSMFFWCNGMRLYE